jgi:hypothetical protein
VFLVATWRSFVATWRFSSRPGVSSSRTGVSKEEWVSPSKSVAPGRLLTQVAGERQTGALVVGGHPGGTVYLIEGRVTYAESASAPGVGELLTASGRLAGRTWRAALDAGTSRAQVGELLVTQGHLTQGELELCVLGAIYDAGYFALSPAAAPVEFLDGAVHWLGPVVRVDAAAVNRESRRRSRLLNEIFPDSRVDVAPVIPVPRAPVERVTLTAPQWELLVSADGQRTPADLAQLLGRAGYATIQELRRLAALGLIEPPAGREHKTETPDFVRLPRAHGTSAAVHRPVVKLDEGPLVPVVSVAARSSSASRPGGSAAPTSGSSRPDGSSNGFSGAGAAPNGRATDVVGARPSSGVATTGVATTGIAATGAATTGMAATGAAATDAATSGVTTNGHAAGLATAGPAAGLVTAGPITGGELPPAPDNGNTNGSMYRPPRLARRKPGAKLPKDLPDAGPPIHPGTDEVLLKRIRTALRALR